MIVVYNRYLKAPLVISANPISKTFGICPYFIVERATVHGDVVPRLQELVDQVIVQIGDPLQRTVEVKIELMHNDCNEIVSVIATGLPTPQSVSEGTPNQDDTLDVVGAKIISDAQHVNAQRRKLLDDWVLHDLIREVEVHFVDGERGLGPDGVPADLKVAVDVPDVVRVPVNSLLHDRVGVQLEHVDEALLCYGRSGTNGVQPEPTKSR